MSRPKRQWYPGAIYHVMSRGNRRLLLYQDQEDYSSFLESVIKTKERLPFRLHSLCLMSNHFHMVIETGDTELWKIMQRVFIENPGEDCSRLETKSQEMISELIDPSRIFSCFGNNAREEYSAFVEGKKSHAEQEMLIQKDMKEDDMWLP